MGRVSGEGGSARSDEALGKCGGTATGRRRRLARDVLLPEMKMRGTHQRSSGLPTRSDVSDSATTQRKRRRSHDGAGASHLPRAHPRSSLLARVCVPLVPAGSEAAVTGQKQPQLRRFVFPALLLLQRTHPARLFLAPSSFLITQSCRGGAREQRPGWIGATCPRGSSSTCSTCSSESRTAASW